MILFWSSSGESLPIVYRLRKEGVPAVIYIHNPDCYDNYKGIVRRLTFQETYALLKKKDMTVVFDMSRPNGWLEYLNAKKKKPTTEPTGIQKKDLEVMRMFDIPFNTPSIYGPLAKKLGKSHNIIGTSTFTEHVELDRTAGLDLGKKVGIDVPESYDMKNLHDSLDFLAGRTDLWVFKPHDNQDLADTYVEDDPGELAKKIQKEYLKKYGDSIKHTLQKVVKGHEIGTEAWRVKGEWKHFNHTLEDKTMMNDDPYNHCTVAEAHGSFQNLVWVRKNQDKGLLYDAFQKLGPMLDSAGYQGPFNFTCIVDREDHKPKLLELDPRYGYDAVFALHQLMDSPLGEFYENEFNAVWYKGMAGSERITIPPFPTKENIARVARGRSINTSMKVLDEFFWMEDVMIDEAGDLICAGSDAILGVSTGRGKNLDETVADTYKNIGKIKASAYLRYRTDLGVRAKKALSAFDRWGIEVE